MWPDRVSNPGPLTYESGVLPTALRSPAHKESRVRCCRFVQFCEYFYHIFLTRESYLFICHCQPNTHYLFALVIVYAHRRRLCNNWFRHGSTTISYPQCSLTFIRLVPSLRYEIKDK